MASATQELELFTRDALTRGVDKEAITKALLAAGWSAEQARTALDAYADVTFPIPVPRPRPHLSAREAFLYLLLFSTLYLSCYHLGSLVFDLINRAYPDPADRTYQLFGDTLKRSISYVIIAFPIFIFFAHYIATDLAKYPTKRLSPVRRWLTYLTLLIAAGALMADLITLVNDVLTGELTVRVTLKVLTVLLITGVVMTYYLTDLRKEEKE